MPTAQKTVIAMTEVKLTGQRGPRPPQVQSAGKVKVKVINVDLYSALSPLRRSGMTHAPKRP